MSAEIVHELENRLRIRCLWFLQEGFDPAYMEALIAAIPGVSSVRINPVAACAVVEYDGSGGTRAKILSSCRAEPAETFKAGGHHYPLANPFWVVCLGVVALAVRYLPGPLKMILSLANATPVIAKGVVALFTKGLKVEVLDAAVVVFCLMRRDFFTSNAVIFFLALAEYLEEMAEDRSSELLKHLLKPAMETAWIEKDGQEISIPINHLKVGEIVVCGPGDTIPIDGVIKNGEALVNQSSLTGEAVPVHKGPGDEALSGSVVAEGKIYIIAERIGTDTTMARINRYLHQALQTKSGFQRRSEELADKLVPISLSLGTGIYVLTGDPSRAASVLTVDYSCSIKLSSPVTVKTLMYAAGQKGVLIKGASALEQIASTDTMVFDKTGTLTTGSLEVHDVIAVNSYSPDAVLALAASAEQHYSHPVAEAVVAEAARRNLSLPDISQVDFIVAHGVSAYIGGKQVLVGSRHFIEDDEGIDCSGTVNLDALYDNGFSLLFVAHDKKLAGIVALKDKIRPEASTVLRSLKKSGVRKIVLLTGDHEKTALALKKGLPEIDEIQYELKPEEKAAFIERLKAEKATVTFVGDGVNDAPALLAAHVGICMPRGSDLAKNAAKVLLMKDDLSGLLVARKAGLNCRKIIENSFWGSVSLNSLYLLLAVTGRLTPVASAALHNLTTVGTMGYCFTSAISIPIGEKNK